MPEHVLGRDRCVVLGVDRPDRAAGGDGKGKIVTTSFLTGDCIEWRRFLERVEVDWTGPIMEGKGTQRRAPGRSRCRCRFPSRIGEPGGNTSPEELMAASHASCFAMALNATVGRKGGSIAPHARHRDDHRRQRRRRHQADDVEVEGRRRRGCRGSRRRSSTRWRERRRASARSRTRCAGRCRSSWRPKLGKRLRRR